MATIAELMASPEYQDALKRMEESQGADAEARQTLMDFQTQFQALSEGSSDQGGGSEDPFIANITQTESRLDPLTQQLLFGLDGEGGFIPGAFRAAERVFFDDQGRPIVIPQEIAGLTPDQLRAAQLQRQAIGVQQPFIEEAMRLGREGLGSLRGGFAGQAEADTRALQELQEASRFALDQRRWVLAH